MSTKIEVVQALRSGAEEIRALQRELELARAKIEGFELAAMLVQATPRWATGVRDAGEDIAWKMRHVASEVEEAGLE